MGFDDVVGLVTLAGVVLAIFLAMRKGKRTAYEAGRASVLASIGSSVVVHNHNTNGHRLGSSEHHNDHDATYDHDHGRAVYGHPRFDAVGPGDDPRVLLGVPVGTHAGRRARDVRQERALSLIDSEEAFRIVRGLTESETERRRELGGDHVAG